MKHSVRSYLAESALLDQKSTRVGGIYRESCALFDRATLTALLHREDQSDLSGSPAEFAALPVEEQAFFHRVLETSDNAVLHGDRGVLILLRHAESATGLLLALRFPITGGERQHLLRAARQMGFALSPTCQRLCRGGKPEGAEQYETVGDRLRELCELLTCHRVQHLSGRIMRLAAFAGIALDVSHLPQFPSHLSATQRIRLLTFLLCLFLTLRQQNGKLELRDLPFEASAPFEEDEEPPSHLRLEWSRIPASLSAACRSNGQAASLPPVLNRPCFEEFRIVHGPDGMTVELALHPRRLLIRANGAPRSILLLRLIPTDLTAEPTTTNLSGEAL